MFWDRKISAVLEAVQLLLLHEGLHGVLLVLGAEAGGEGQGLVGGGGGDVALDAIADSLLGSADGDLCLGSDLVGQLQRVSIRASGATTLLTRPISRAC